MNKSPFFTAFNTFLIDYFKTKGLIDDNRYITDIIGIAKNTSQTYFIYKTSFVYDMFKNIVDEPELYNKYLAEKFPSIIDLFVSKGYFTNDEIYDQLHDLIIEIPPSHGFQIKSRIHVWNGLRTYDYHTILV